MEPMVSPVIMVRMVSLALMESPVIKVVHRSAPIKRSTYVSDCCLLFHWTSLGEPGLQGIPGDDGDDGNQGA